MTRYDQRYLFFMSILYGFLLYSSCSEKLSYDEYVSIELSKGVLNDSIVYGVRFGMTFSEFDAYCLAMNKKNFFMPNHNGSAVRMKLDDGFNEPVYFDFFPTASVDQNIIELTASMTYQNFSYYDKRYGIDNLVHETNTFFEKGYGGNKFFSIPHENKLLKQKYVKIDGNRKIEVSQNFDGQMVNIVFKNLNTECQKLSIE